MQLLRKLMFLTIFSKACQISYYVAPEDSHSELHGKVYLISSTSLDETSLINKLFLEPI